MKNLANLHIDAYRLETDFMGGKTITHTPTGRSVYLQPGEDAAALEDEPTAATLAEYFTQPDKLTHHSSDPDNFREYYKNTATGALYCWQVGEFYACTAQGEPSHKVNPRAFEFTEPHAWLDRHVTAQAPQRAALDKLAGGSVARLCEEVGEQDEQ